MGVFCPQGVLEPIPSRTAHSGKANETETGSSEESKSPEDIEGDALLERPPLKPDTPRKVYRPRNDDLCVCIPNPRGQHFRAMGQADQFNRMWLLPEEALYLIERGSLDIRWPVKGLGEDEKVDAINAAEQGIPMSLQAAYACLMGRGGLSVERYTVFSGLKRGGYAVIRAEGWDNKYSPPRTPLLADVPQNDHISSGEEHRTGFLTLLSRFFNLINNSRSTCSTSHGPIIGLGIHRSYGSSSGFFSLVSLADPNIDDVFRALSIIPAFDPDVPDTDPRTIESAAHATSPYRLAFNVYKPSTPFRKSSPGTPDFRIAVINARTHPNLPSLADLAPLLASTPLTPPRGEKLDRLMYMRLRHGWRSIILGVVDQGVVSYLRVADAGFIKDPLYVQKGTVGPGGKGHRKPPGKKGGR